MNQVLELLTRQLNNDLKKTFDLSEDIAIAGRLVDSDGNVPVVNQNKLIFSLVNITAEMNRPIYGQKVGFANKELSENQPLFMNVDLLLTSNFSDELETAKFLSAGIQFFHGSSVFNKETDPSFPTELDKVNMEIYNLSLKELNDLWSSIGTSMIPSALYKVRVIQVN